MIMKKSAKKWIVGSGVIVAGAAAVGAASRGVSKYLVKLAMDREGLKNTKKGKTHFSGMKEDGALEMRISQAKQALEAQPHEKVVIEGNDSVLLVGHWYPCDEPKRIIVAMHGWRSSWLKDFVIIAPFWQANGCSILFAEQRAQGESGGEYMGFGLLERYDCKNWIDWIMEKDGSDIPIYLAGLSMGATTVLMAGGLELPERVHGIMADCGFTSAHEIWKHVMEENLHLHYGLYASAANELCRKKIQIGASDHSTIDALKNCKVPVLLIHGTDDSFVPIEMTYENYKACASDKRLFVVPGAEHALSYCIDQAGYEQTVREFWREYDEKDSIFGV